MVWKYIFRRISDGFERGGRTCGLPVKNTENPEFSVFLL